MEQRCPHCDSPVAQAEQKYCLQCGIDLAAETQSSSPDLGSRTTLPAEEGPDQAMVDTTRTEALIPATVVERPSLKIVLPTGDEYIKQLSRPQIRLGKGPHNDIVISDPSVSSAHALIARGDDGYTISDLGSRNGTFVNQERVIEARRLRNGDLINLGRSRLTFQSGSAGDTVALPTADIELPTLVGVTPDGSRIESVIDRSETGLGKAAHNQVVVPDSTVSSAHAIILAKGGGEYAIVDLGSRNGTYVSGERLGSAPRALKHGDTIKLGGTVLTFRNPSRATETTTALPSELIDKASKQPEGGVVAAAGVVAGGALAGQLIGADATAAAAQAASEPVIKADSDSGGGKPKAEGKEKVKKADKDKKKKKKEKDERLRAAYIGALGRVVAAVLSVILTVGIAFYIKEGGLTSKPEVTAGRKGKAKLKLGNLTAGAAINGGSFRASGVVQVPDSNGVLFVDRSNPRQVFWMELDDSGAQVGAARPIDLGITVEAPEGITYGEHFFYVVGSQSDPKAGEANSLVRFAFDPSSFALKGKAEAAVDLRSLLLTNVPELKSGLGDKGAISVEGIAWDPDHERLMLGLRSPVANGKALIVALKIRDPLAPFSAGNLQFAEPVSLQLPLGGLGVCDIQYDSRLKSFLIVAGDSSIRDKKGLELWEWDGNPVSGQDDSAIRKDSSLDEKMKVEGIGRVNIGQHDYLLLVGDSGSYSKIDYSKSE